MIFNVHDPNQANIYWTTSFDVEYMECIRRQWFAFHKYSDVEQNL